MLEETIIKLTEAINRAAAAIDAGNKVNLLYIQFRKQWDAPEVPVAETPSAEVSSPAPEVKTPTTRKPKAAPTVLPDPTVEEISYPSQNDLEQLLHVALEKDVEPTPEPEPEPAKTESTEPVTGEDLRLVIRSYVQKKLSGDPIWKKKWKAFLAEWKAGTKGAVENLAQVEVGDLPDFFEQVKALGN